MLINTPLNIILPFSKRHATITGRKPGLIEISVGTSPAILFHEDLPLYGYISTLDSYGLVAGDIAYIISAIVGIL